MSDTPRTDAQIARYVVAEGDTDTATQLWSDMADHARQLERENAELCKDAERYRWLKKDHAMLWSSECNGSVKWVRYIEMPDPDIRAEFLTETSVMEALDRAIDAAIAREAKQ